MQPLLFNDPAKGIRRPHDCAWLVSLSYILQFSLYFILQNILFTPSDRRNDDESTSSSTSSTEEYFTPTESASKPSTSYFATSARVALGRSSLSTSSGLGSSIGLQDSQDRRTYTPSTSSGLGLFAHGDGSSLSSAQLKTSRTSAQGSSGFGLVPPYDGQYSWNPLIHPPLPNRVSALKETESKLVHQPVTTVTSKIGCTDHHHYILPKCQRKVYRDAWLWKVQLLIVIYL